MSKRTETKFSQHLYLMGDRFDDRITQWFKGAVIIEHDLAAISGADKFALLMRICSVTMGHKITKLTEVIGGAEKGMSLARLSGAYPVAITQETAYERGLLTRIVDVTNLVRAMNRKHENYSECLRDLRRNTHGLTGVSVSKLGAIHAAIENHNKVIGDLIAQGVTQNFRRLLV